MGDYERPGVYVEEVPTLPPSVAEVSTAVPAFIGRTEKGPPVARVGSLLEYEEQFGKAKPTRFEIFTARDPNTGLETVDRLTLAGDSADQPEHLLYYCVSHYFKNGGGPCYIVSVGNYETSPDKQRFIDGLASLSKEDEPTLIVLTDAVKLAAVDYFAVCQDALAQCADLRDRFVILDVPDGKYGEFRDMIGTDGLMYGAAYYPYLLTTLNLQYSENDVRVLGPDEHPDIETWEREFGGDGIVVRFRGAPDSNPRVKIVAGTPSEDMEFFAVGDQAGLNNVAGSSGEEVVTAWNTWFDGQEIAFDVFTNETGQGRVPHTRKRFARLQKRDKGVPLSDTKVDRTEIYSRAKAALSKHRVVLPPSAAMAGVYARVDRDRGVWNAPANVSVSAVIGPVSTPTQTVQDELNDDPTAGKSINVIRSFAGKGTLVWGARTLAGNDNEWRYVPVRRLFIMVEETIQKATSFAVFEANDATTWLKVKGMIDGYLHRLWERGALAGPTPERSYFVSVGLGKTMTDQDILEGRMIVEVGMAVVRPAEFIVLRFTHKMQEA